MVKKHTFSENQSHAGKINQEIYFCAKMLLWPVEGDLQSAR